MKKRSGFRRGDFMLISQSGLSALQQRCRRKGGLGIRDVGVLHEMLANTGHENLVMVGQQEIARLTGMDLVSVYKCSRRLMDAGFIERVEERRGWYRISPKLVWKGSGEAHRSALAAREAAAYLKAYAEATAKEEVA